MINKEIKNNIFFSLFFSLFFTLYQYVFVQIILFVILALYVFNDLYKNKKMKLGRVELSNILFIILWFGLFVLYVSLSQKWAIGRLYGSRTITSIIRRLYVGIMIALYCDSYEKTIGIVKSFILGVFIMGAVILIFTPPSLYGVEVGEKTFGGFLYQQRNPIAAAATESILFIFYLKKFNSIKYSKFLIIFFIILLLCSGSRGGIVELAVFFSLYFFMNYRDKKTYKYIFRALCLLLLFYFFIQINPYLYDKIYIRFVNLFDTLLSNNNIDGSVYSRSLIKKVAIDIFKSHKLLGIGVDGVTIYLSQFPRHYGYYFRAVYSHCNYTEIAADFGIIGLFIWYVPLLNFIIKILMNLKKSKSNELTCLFSMIIAMIFLDNFRIPWSDYLPIYSYFIIIILTRNYIYKKYNT